MIVLTLGADLKIGDTFIPWYEKTAIISALSPYSGKLSRLFKDGAQIAEFSPNSEFGGRGMIIDNSQIYKVVRP